MTAPQSEPRALPDLIEYLTYQHQQDQESLAARTATGLSLLWAILRFADLDGSTPPWLHATTLQIETLFRESEALAFDYVQGVKWASLPTSDPLVKVDTVFPTRDVQNSMRITGPVNVKAHTVPAMFVPEENPRGLDVPPAAGDVLERAKLASTGAGVKHVMNGGRGEVQALVERDFKQADADVKRSENAFDKLNDSARAVLDRQFADLKRFEAELADLRSQGRPETYGRIVRLKQLMEPLQERLDGYEPGDVEAVEKSEPRVRQARNELAAKRKVRDSIGWARVTDSDPCYFCAILASLGAAFLSESAFERSNKKFTGEGTAKVHDHCQCHLRPVYREADRMDARAKNFLKQWNDLTEGLSSAASKGHMSEAMKAFRRGYVPPKSNNKPPAVNLSAVKANREALSAGLGSDAPQVAFYRRIEKELA